MSANNELDDIRLDIEVLRALIDAALDRGVHGSDPLLRAIAAVLQDRRHRLEQLSRDENAAAP
jgi:hypothetical protein